MSANQYQTRKYPASLSYTHDRLTADKLRPGDWIVTAGMRHAQVCCMSETGWTVYYPDRSETTNLHHSARIGAESLADSKRMIRRKAYPGFPH